MKTITSPNGKHLSNKAKVMRDPESERMIPPRLEAVVYADIGHGYKRYSRDATPEEVKRTHWLAEERAGKVRIELNGEVLYVRPDTYRILCDTYMPKESER